MELRVERLAELRRIAEMATPGPWRIPGAHVFRVVAPETQNQGDPYYPWAVIADADPRSVDGEQAAANACYIAEFHPPTVLALLDEIERLRRALEGFRLMAEVLRELEWSGWDERFQTHMCPVCGGYKSKNKHFPDCDLNKALSFLRCGEALPTPDDAARAFREIERLQAEMERLQDEMERLHGALNISPDDVGRIMHESWSRTKRSQGFHHPSECPNGRWVETAHGRAPCPKCHADLISWDNLPEPQKDINRHAFDDVLAEIRRRAAIAERVGESG